MKTAALIFMLVAAWPAWALGGVVVSLNNPGSTTLHEVQVAPGGTFTVDVNIETAANLLYAVDFLAQASASDVFQITNRTNQAPWTQGDGGIGALNPTSARAYWDLPYPDYFGPGASTLGTLEFAVAASAQQVTYTIIASSIRCHEGRAVPAEGSGTSGEGFIVRVVPEPATLVLILTMAGLLIRRSR